MAASKKNISVLSSLLFGSKATHPKGRVIKFDENIADIKLSTGTLSQRVIAALEHTTHPMTAKEIADRISAAPPRVYTKIKQLVEDGVLAEVKPDGCVTEYILMNDPNLSIR